MTDAGNERVIARTERLVIRPWRTEEAPRLLDILSRVEVARWLGDGEPELMRDLDEARARIERYHERCDVPPRGFWAVEVRDTGRVAGSVLIMTLPDDEHGEVEIGWHLHPDSWGNGYASEAAAAVLAYPSQAVARRIGMETIGVMEKWYQGPSMVFRAGPSSGAPRDT